MQTNETQTKQADIKNALSSLFANEDLNNYAMENAVLGKISAGDDVPVQTYAKELKLPETLFSELESNSEGRAIDENGKLRENLEDENFRKDFYTFGMSIVFDKAPKNSYDFDDDGLLPFKFGLKEYLLELFPLFEQIAAYPIEHDAFDLMRADSEQAQESVCACRELIANIKIKGIKQGKCVNKYVKSFSHIPYFACKLLTETKGKFVLSNADVQSLDYKLALLSLLPFRNTENAALFELKAKAWFEKNYR